MTAQAIKTRRFGIIAVILAALMVFAGLAATPDSAQAAYGNSAQNVGRTGNISVKLDNGSIKVLTPGQKVSSSVRYIWVSAGTCVGVYRSGGSIQRICAHPSYGVNLNPNVGLTQAFRAEATGWRS